MLRLWAFPGLRQAAVRWGRHGMAMIWKPVGGAEYGYTGESSVL